MVSLEDIEIRELTSNDTQEFLDLKKIGLSTDPYSFLADLEDEEPDYFQLVKGRLSNASIKNGDVILGAFLNGLVGIVAVTRNKNKKRKHKADLHGMYIKPEYRGIGLGRELLCKILIMSEKIKGLEEIELIVAANSKKVVELYGSFGFEKVYLEKHALKIDNEYVDAFHMKKEMTFQK